MSKWPPGVCCSTAAPHASMSKWPPGAALRVVAGRDRITVGRAGRLPWVQPGLCAHVRAFARPATALVDGRPADFQVVHSG